MFETIGTFWAIVPPIIAIALALITKEVYVSLFVGVLSGALLYTKFNILASFELIIELLDAKLGDAWNLNILIFLVMLGILVALMSKSGATAAYGKWASKSIKSKKGALLATSALGVLIFVDDYFNCLTVGTVMAPVTDRFKISREKLSYIIDATAAPVCIIAPISSWAAAVGSSIPPESGVDGFSLFVKAIPFNFYALGTILMLVVIALCNIDFGPMKKAEESVLEVKASEEEVVLGKGKVFDLIAPILMLIAICIACMMYTGGFFGGEGVSIAQSFADCDAAYSLALGSFLTIILTFILYIPRRVVTFKAFAESIPEGFKAMVPAILILTLAWCLGGICRDEYLNAGGYVSWLVTANNIPMGILPAIFFLVSLGLAFATGTSWGTFAILLPIVTSVFQGPDGLVIASDLFTMAVASVLAGAVCGDHISPISDTTIMASTGAQCDHIKHVSTQIPYAMYVSAMCFIGYLVGGLVNVWAGLAVAMVLIFAGLMIIKYKTAEKLS